MTTLDDLLAQARERLDRLGPEETRAALEAGGVLVDIRPHELRAADGYVPGSVHVPRNVLEWRCAPSSEARDPAISDPARRVVIMCDEGYQSSLAAAVLHDLGLPLATDLDGGYQAWRAAGLPVSSLAP
jgi:rhodanese-related sulfurtransferase